ncbi:MAG TPA: phage Gp37/Gp68 family protein [Chthoniobacterales bacterium]|nr:phage Gp37/Gp68 family protein [Chthoniobacterales bacterium]
MGETTKISWTEHTWNPWRGCTKISPGCAHCYMYTQQERYGGNPFVVQQSKTTWNDPLRWQREAAAAGRIERVFTCSWSDFFHKDADAWRYRAWDVIWRCPNLQFQILTKRPERIAQNLPSEWHRRWPWSNVQLGVSVENEKYLWRVDELRKIPARVHFISAEPLLAGLPGLDLSHIEWLIVGGESGPGFRPMKTEWARELRDKAQGAGTAFFFKQISAPRTEMGCLLDGREWKEYPA